MLIICLHFSVSREWTKISSELLGLEDAAITLGTGTSISNNESFWILGGANAQQEYPDYTVYFDAKTPEINKGVDMNNGIGRHGHCAVNVEFLVDKQNLTTQWNQVMVIGGKDVGTTAETFCKGATIVNNKVCDVPYEKFAWSPFPSLLEVRDGHSCTSFNHRVFGSVIMVAGGYQRRSSEIFFIKECALSAFNTVNCEWQNQINGNPLDIPGLPRVAAAMTTLNNIPTIFGGVLIDDSYAQETEAVWKFVDVYDNGSIINQWEHSWPMKTKRQRHSVVSVPIDFLCYQETETSIRRYTMQKYI